MGNYDDLPDDLRQALERHNRLHDLVHDAINALSPLDLNLKWLRDAHAYNDVGKTRGLNIKFEELEQVHKLLEQAEAHMEEFMATLSKPKEEG